ncbi:hypothetical protein CC86DRAFT_373351 [Ophiobolus disseminans]|uniref:Uncharacterized protein n=1 Tax=Ophiobolus disseminans TaxID=1469910 RepID=A0A6A6ZPK1_9PLEO|nr:hypothetical protein CC86DRAFT_373351 [Ophiobolus disseminans]
MLQQSRLRLSLAASRPRHTPTSSPLYRQCYFRASLIFEPEHAVQHVGCCADGHATGAACTGVVTRPCTDRKHEIGHRNRCNDIGVYMAYAMLYLAMFHGTSAVKMHAQTA